MVQTNVLFQNLSLRLVVHQESSTRDFYVIQQSNCLMSCLKITKNLPKTNSLQCCWFKHCVTMLLQATWFLLAVLKIIKTTKKIGWGSKPQVTATHTHTSLTGTCIGKNKEMYVTRLKRLRSYWFCQCTFSCSGIKGACFFL